MNDPYIYPGTQTLINKFNIKNAEELERIEKEYTTISLQEIKSGYVKGTFDIEHLKSIHKHIFEEVYPWAGNLRTINIEKSENILGGLSVDYASIENIEKDIKIALKELNSIKWKEISFNDKVHDFSRLMADVWKAHGFREGNTRTTINFFSEFAKENGFPLNTELLAQNSKFVRNSLVAASFEEKGYGIERNYSHLERIVKDSIKQGSIEHSIKEFYKEELPSIKYASIELVKKLYNINIDISEDGRYVSISEIKAKYNELGKKVDDGLLSKNDSTFNLISDVKQELNSLQLHSNAIEKNINNEINRKFIDMQL